MKDKSNGTIMVQYRESPLMASARRRRISGRSADTTAKDPVLLTRQGLATALSCSLRKIDHLQTMGMPCLFVGRARRFIFAEVVAWLKRKGGLL